MNKKIVKDKVIKSCKPCPVCNGAGSFGEDKICPRCKGSGNK